MKKRVLSLLLCILLIFALTPVSALADGGDGADPEQSASTDQEPTPTDGDKDDGDGSTDPALTEGEVTNAEQSVPTGNSEGDQNPSDDNRSNDSESSADLTSKEVGDDAPTGETPTDEPKGNDETASNSEGTDDDAASRTVPSADEKADEKPEEEGTDFVADPELVVEPVQVVFSCDPKDLTLTVYPKPEDENTPEPVRPEADGSYLLLPGEYLYTATAQDYAPAEEVSFTVEPSEKPLTISVTLSPLPMKSEEKTDASEPEIAPQKQEASLKKGVESPEEETETKEQQTEPLTRPGTLTRARTRSATSGTYTLVTAAGQLIAGDEIILVSDNGRDYFAMGSAFSGVQVDLGANSLEAPAGTEALTLVEAEGGWLLSTGSGYLSANGSALTTVTDVESASVWSISIANEEATISTTGNTICYDGTAFYCGSGGNPVAIYFIPGVDPNEMFTITWLNYDGTVLATNETKRGEIPVYAGETPVRTYDSNYSYYFIGWTPDVSPATANTEYTAQYQANKKCGWDAYWFFEEETGTLTIDGSGKMNGDNSLWYDFRDKITRIVIKPGITSIGLGQFYEYYTRVTSILIPNTVTYIGYYAFNGCTKLTTINIPDSVMGIGKKAFENTKWWNQQGNGTVYLDNVLLGYKGECTQQILSVQPGTRVVADEAMIDCSSLIRITIPNSVISIGSGAFSGCSGLTSVFIPDNVTSIGSSAFSNCSGLKSITIPDSVTSIGDSAFYNCTGLTSITIPDSVTDLGQTTFGNCTGLTSITIPDGVNSIGCNTFINCSGLTSVTIPNSVSNIENRAFQDCTGLTSIIIPDSVTRIGDYAFSGCTGLTDLTVPCSTQFYSWTSFNDCTGITNINLTRGSGLWTNSGYSKTPWYANRSNNLTILLEEGITGIGEKAFYKCSGLVSITIPNSVTSIGDQAFCDCTGLKSLTIPCSANAWNKFTRCSGIVSVHVTCGNGHWQLNDDIAYPTPWYYSSSNDMSITLDEGITSIGGYAFYNCTGLSSIIIPDSVTSIGNHAFYGCSGLTSIAVPDSVTNIGDSAFSGCTRLTSIMIPNSVTNIGSYAFSGCDELSDVYYLGTEKQKNDIAIGDNNSPFLSATWHYLPSAEIVSRSVTFEGKLQVNFYVQAAEELLADEGSYALLTFNGATSKQLVKDAPASEKNGIVRRKFVQNVFAKQMGDQIKLQFFTGDDQPVLLFDSDGTDVTTGYLYSVDMYVETVSGSTTLGTNEKRLVQACGAYGTAAQLMFGYKPEGLAVPAEVTAVTLGQLAAFEPVYTGTLPAGIKRNTSTVIFEADNTLRQYFYLETGHTINEYTFTIDNGDPVSPTYHSPGKYYLEIRNIPAQFLENPHTFTVTNNTDTYSFTFSALSYAYKILNAGDAFDANTQNLVKALYLYNQAANQYFDNR